MKRRPNRFASRSFLADYVLLALVDRSGANLDLILILEEAVLVVVLIARNQVHVVDGYEHLRALDRDLVHLPGVGEQEKVQTEHRYPLGERSDHVEKIASLRRLPFGSVGAVEFSNAIRIRTCRRRREKHVKNRCLALQTSRPEGLTQSHRGQVGDEHERR